MVMFLNSKLIEGRSLQKIQILLYREIYESNKKFQISPFFWDMTFNHDTFGSLPSYGTYILYWQVPKKCEGLIMFFWKSVFITPWRSVICHENGIFFSKK